MNSDVISFIKNNLDWDINKIREISSLNGLNNNCYKIKYDNKDYYLRITNNDSINSNEFNIINLCSSLELCYKPIYYCKKTNNMISPWINGHMPTEKEFSSTNFINNLVKKIKILHNQKISTFFNPFDEIRNNIKLCKEINISLPKNIDSLLNKLFYIESYCKNNYSLGLCHNDLNVSNIILNNNIIFIIDYEFTAMGDIFFDLATLAWMMNDTGRKTLITSYFKESTKDHFLKLEYYIFIVKFWNATWSLIKSKNNTSKYDYLLSANLIFSEI